MGKNKTIELKAKVDKISKEHLTELQDIVNGVNKVQFAIGKIESQKHAMLHEMFIEQKKVSDMQQTLEKEYGTSDVNINDGTINWDKDGE
jgi:hypothetical protein|tara:strand:+ start:84 stop:353 length:270 start_codon:yes stop_codon:yes gene_type:complete